MAAWSMMRVAAPCWLANAGSCLRPSGGREELVACADRKPSENALSNCYKAFGDPDTNASHYPGRRQALVGLFVTSSSVCASTVLWPSRVNAAEFKQTNLPIEEVMRIIENDIKVGQYLTTGRVTRSIYNENCRFKDPTTDVTGVERYVDALQFLFDPSTSHHELISIEVINPRIIEAKWKLGGYMKFPWHPYIAPYEGVTQYSVDDDGLIEFHNETWNVSGFQVFQQFLTPSWN